MRFIIPFQRLNWKLTLSYTLVTVGTLLVLELVILLGIQIVASSAALGWTMTGILQNEALPPLRETLEQQPKDAQAQLARLFPGPADAISEAQVLPLGADDVAVLLDPQGKLIAQQPGEPANRGANVVSAERIPGLAKILPPALSGERDQNKLTWRENAQLTIIIPIVAENKPLLGFLVYHASQTRSLADNFSGILQVLTISFVIFTGLAGVIGTIFGFFTARGLTRRLRHVAETSAAWGRGDFSQRVHDASPDELGQLAAELNAMSRQLQDVMQTRQQLAALDERNRLARDLHDSVKQQVFGIRMNLAAIQSLWESDPEKARARLDAALQLTGQAQQELTGLIQALHPSALEEKGLAQSLREMLNEYTALHGVQTEIQINSPVVPSRLTEQALFRIVHEALSNAARHSGASAVNLTLDSDAAQVTLKINDNGRGFDPGKPVTGLGLISMRERVAALGGSLTLESDQNGTRLTVVIPV